MIYVTKDVEWHHDVLAQGNSLIECTSPNHLSELPRIDAGNRHSERFPVRKYTSVIGMKNHTRLITNPKNIWSKENETSIKGSAKCFLLKSS